MLFNDPDAGLESHPIELTEEQLEALANIKLHRSLHGMYPNRFADEDRMLKWLISRRLINTDNIVTVRGIRSIIYTVKGPDPEPVEVVEGFQYTYVPPPTPKKSKTDQYLVVRVNNIEFPMRIEERIRTWRVTITLTSKNIVQMGPTKAEAVHKCMHEASRTLAHKY